MGKTEMIRARIEPKLKAESERILNELRLGASDAIRVFYKQVVLRNGLPFDVAIPNEATRRAMRDVQKRRGLTRYKDTGEIRGEMSALSTEDYMEGRAQRGNRKRFERAMAKVENRAPDSKDRL